MQTSEWKSWFDGVSFTLAFGIVLGLIPLAVGLLTILYTTIQIYETKTFQAWLAKRRK